MAITKPTKRKRRERSISPERPSNIGAKRRQSPGNSSRSDSSNTTSLTTREPSSLRSKSLFRGDNYPYSFSQAEPRASLSTSEEWNFRLKYLCRGDPSDDMFKEAVQGLIKICFPAGVLDQLSLDIIESQMQEQGATDARILKMRELVQLEMVHKLAWLLAEQLDTPEKTETAITSVIAARHRLHGKKSDYDVFKDIIRGFEKLRDQYAQSGTDHLASGASIRLPTRDRPESEVSQRSCTRIGLLESEPAAVALTDPSSMIPSIVTKASKKASWDIDKKAIQQLSPMELKAKITKPRYLFAYHALPIVRGDMKEDASYDEIKVEIFSRWTGLSANERNVWRTSYRNLLKGDLEMLTPVQTTDHLSTSPSHNSRATHSADICEPPNVPDHYTNTMEHQECSCDDQDSEKVTRAPGSIKDIISHRSVQSKEDGYNQTLVTIKKERRTSLPDLSMNVISTPPQAVRTYSKTDIHHRLMLSITPIVDLLYETAFRLEERATIWGTIINGVVQRIQAEKIKTVGPGGRELFLTVGHLEMRMREAFENPITFDPAHTRQIVERALEPWIGSKPYAFPELKKSCSLFKSIMLDITPIMDLLYINGPPISKLNSGMVLDHIMEALRARQSSKGYRKFIGNTDFGLENSGPFRSRLNSAFKSQNFTPNIARGKLDWQLRPFILANRSRFPELKDSPLVKEWEILSGWRWLPNTRR